MGSIRSRVGALAFVLVLVTSAGVSGVAAPSVASAGTAGNDAAQTTLSATATPTGNASAETATATPEATGTPPANGTSGAGTPNETETPPANATETPNETESVENATETPAANATETPNETETPAANATETSTDASGNATDSAAENVTDSTPTESASTDVPTESNVDDGSVADSAGTTFVVEQAGESYAVTPLGNGTETVSSFYDYGVASEYSSAGTTHLQENQASNLFVYHGAEGYSLVFLHDEYGPAPGGSTASVTVTGLPESGTWAIEDDAYQGRDDSFDHAGDRSEIDWKWASNRTDGAAFRGIGAADGPVTIEPGFNEDADAWGEWPYSGDADNRTESWRLLGADGSTVTTLDLDANVSVSPAETDANGSDGSDDSNDSDDSDDSDDADEPADDEPPTADVQLPDRAVVGEQVTIRARNVSDEGDVAHVCWFVDGTEGPDGETLTHTFEEAGTHTVTLVLVDEAGNRNEVTREITVEPREDGPTGDDEPPTADVDVPDEVTIGEPVTLRATNVADETGLRHVCWLVDGDEGPHGKTMTHAFDEPGTHTVTLVLVDEAGNRAELTREVVAVADDGGPTEDAGSADEAAASDEADGDSEDGLGASDWTRSSDVSADWPPSEGPSLSVANLTVADEAVDSDEPTTLRVTVANDGDETETKRFTATVDGTAVGTTVVTVSPGNAYTKTFAVTVEEPGDHEVRIGSRSVALSVADDEGAARTDDASSPADESASAIPPGQADAPQETATPTPAAADDSDDDGGAFAVVWSFFAGIVGLTVRYGTN